MSRAAEAPRSSEELRRRELTVSDPFGRCTAMITRQRGVRQTNIGGDDAARRRSGRPAPETESCQEDDDDAPMSIDASIAASELNYQRLLEWNERYDAKTSIVLTLSTAMLGVVGAMTFGLPANALSFPTVWAAHSAISFPLGACILEVGRHILISILCALWWSHMTRRKEPPQLETKTAGIAIRRHPRRLRSPFGVSCRADTGPAWHWP